MGLCGLVWDYVGLVYGYNGLVWGYVGLVEGYNGLVWGYNVMSGVGLCWPGVGL